MCVCVSVYCIYLTVLRTENQLQFFEKPQRWHDWHDVFAHAEPDDDMHH